MKEEPKMSSWVLVVVFGVLAVLFAVFGLQQQTEAAAMKEELAQSRAQSQAAEQEAIRQHKLCEEMTRQAAAMNATLKSQLEECQKNKGK